jgi:transcriptional regulator with XRE-family HTH domain
MRERKSHSYHVKLLRDLRIQKGYSRAELSDKSGVSQTVLYKIEVLGYIPSQRTIEKLAAVLGEEVRALFES